MRTPNPRKTAIYPIIPIAFQWAFPGAFEAPRDEFESEIFPSSSSDEGSEGSDEEGFRRLFHPLAAWRWRVRGRGRRLRAGELDRARHAAIQLDETVSAVWDMRIPIAHWGGRGEVDFEGAPIDGAALDLDHLARVAMQQR
eukprot:scaffold1430_cov139-Isochrysis_galbana.AAC.2